MERRDDEQSDAVCFAERVLREELKYHSDYALFALKNGGKCIIIIVTADLGGVNMIRIAIVDDENVICSSIERCICEYCEAMHLKTDIDIFNSGESILKNLHNNTQYHLIFLDIELVQCNGIDVAHEIRDVILDEITQIIFISGKDGYDRQLFAFRPFSFIPKPFTAKHIHNTIEKYFRIYGKQNELFSLQVWS